MWYLESLLFPYLKQTLRKQINSSNSSNVTNKYYAFISNFMWIIVDLSDFHYQNAGAFLSIYFQIRTSKTQIFCLHKNILGFWNCRKRKASRLLWERRLITWFWAVTRMSFLRSASTYPLSILFNYTSFFLIFSYVHSCLSFSF